MAGFIRETITEITPIVKHDFRHSLCRGETGCGKTTSFMLPNIENRIKSDYGMLIIDVKGNLHFQVKVLAAKHKRLKDVKEIGVPWGENINIFKNITRSLFLDTLKNLNGDMGDKFWINSALNFAGQLYDSLAIYKNIEALVRKKVDMKFHYKFDAASLNNILSNYDSLETFINKSKYAAKCLDPGTTAKLRLDNISKEDVFLISQFKIEFMSVINKIEIFYNDIDQGSPASGSGGVYTVLKNLMHLFTQTSFNGNSELKELIEDGKIVILRTDSYDENTTLAMMNILYKRLLVRNNTRPISLFIDEFQRSVSKDNIPYIDLFREMNVELIAAMQNIQQLENKIGDVRCSELLGNILHNYEYSNHRENSLETFEYIYRGTKAIANPVFLSNKKKVITQIKWQNLSEHPLPLGYIYVRPDGYKRAIITHIRTKKVKYFYMLDEAYRKALMKI